MHPPWAVREHCIASSSDVPSISFIPYVHYSCQGCTEARVVCNQSTGFPCRRCHDADMHCVVTFKISYRPPSSAHHAEPVQLDDVAECGAQEPSGEAVTHRGFVAAPNPGVDLCSQTGYSNPLGFPAALMR